MIIVTPAVGSVPEPRPQSLVTGDRAIQLLDASASTALQAAGVKVVTVSLTVYTEITSELVAESNTDVDPNTGVLKPSVLPAYLSQSAINALNLLDGTNHLSETYVPTRLSPTTLTATIQGASATTTSDPDGTPVIVANPTSGTNVTYTGTITGSTINAGTGHADLFTANVSTVGTEEITGALSLDDQTVVPVAAASKVKLYSAGQRPSFVDSAGIAYLVGNKRIVTAWPTSGMQLGDEAIMSSTGERRIYLGATKGWRLAGPHMVSSLTERNALVPYNGMKVYCDFGYAQDHYYANDSKWHGTQTWMINGGPVHTVQNVNDTNFHRWSETTLLDPGFDYRIQGRVAMEVVMLNQRGRAEVWWSLCDFQTGANFNTFDIAFNDGWNSQFGETGPQAARFQIPVITYWPQSGSRTIVVDWKVDHPNANAYSGSYQATQDYFVVPC